MDHKQSQYNVKEAKRCLEKGDEQHARIFFTRAIKYNPKNLNIYMVRAKHLMEKNLIELALVDLQQVLIFSPNNPAAHGMMGEIFLKMRLKDEALAAFEKAIDGNVRDASYYEKFAKLQDWKAQKTEDDDDWEYLRKAIDAFRLELDDD